MKNILLKSIAFMAIGGLPYVTPAQAPSLGTTANFALFSTIGAVTNTGPSFITGDVGTNSGACTGFGVFNGVQHNGDAATALCAADLLGLYNYLNAMPPSVYLLPVLGNGQVLTQSVYYLSSASSLSQDLTLDAQGDTSALFVFQIEGAFSTAALSEVILANGALACNVFWKVEGAISMAEASIMKGTMVANNAAIELFAGSLLEGRALSTTGAVTTHETLISAPADCNVPILTCGVPGTIYVDDDAVGANDGSSWYDAFSDLQSALAVAISGSVILVKEGLYPPTQGADRAARFELLPDVSLYGGFAQSATCDTAFNQRDPFLYESILTGNIGDLVSADDNSFCVMRGYNIGHNVIVDGFIISDGYTEVITRPATFVISASGAGMECSPHVENCIFRNNRNLSYGGAVHIRAVGGALSAPTFGNCRFLNNAGTSFGGAIYLAAKSTASLQPMFNNCTFDNNTLSGSAHGGAVAQLLEAYCTSALSFSDCTFNNHHVVGNGGAVWSSALKSTDNIVFIHSTFNHNSSTNGGAIYQKGSTSQTALTMTACTLDGNAASGDGGALYSYGDKNTIGQISVRRTLFVNNQSARGAGAFLYNLGAGCLGTGNFSNCIFNNNSSTTYGGALSFWARSLSRYTNTLNSCTIYGNSSATVGGAVSNYVTTAGSSAVVDAQNCIIMGNPAVTGKAFYNANVGSVTNIYNCILDFASCPSNSTGTGIFNCLGMLCVDPLFADAANGDFHLLAGSPAIDAGGPGVSLDFEGEERPQGAGYDIGAYEYNGNLPRLAANETVQHSNFTILPNPTDERFVIALDQPVQGFVEIVNVQGIVVLTAPMQGINQISLSLRGQSPGTYFVHLVTEQGSTVNKMLLK